MKYHVHSYVEKCLPHLHVVHSYLPVQARGMLECLFDVKIENYIICCTVGICEYFTLRLEDNHGHIHMSVITEHNSIIKECH